MARGVHHDLDGSFSSTNPAMSSLIQRISEVNDEVRKGTRSTNRENDLLTQALGNKEHPGRTRGAGLVPWKIAFEEGSSTYRSRSRGRAAQEAEYMRVLKEMEDKFKKGIDEWVQEKVNVLMASMGSGVVPQEPLPTSFCPHFRGRNSCGSTPLNDEEENAPHPVDSITEPINVRMYILTLMGSVMLSTG